jgi:hypothetical protein
MVAISFGVALLQQESLYDYLLNPLVVSMAHCFPVKKTWGGWDFFGWEHTG